MQFPKMIELFSSYIKDGMATMDDVPPVFRDEVEAYLIQNPKDEEHETLKGGE